MVRIARPASLAIWHRGHSHRKPNRNESPNRRHFASLDLKKTCRFFASQANIAGFSQGFFCYFPVIFRSSEWAFASLAKKHFRIASDLGVCDSNRIAHRGCIARFGPLRVRQKKGKPGNSGDVLLLFSFPPPSPFFKNTLGFSFSLVFFSSVIPFNIPCRFHQPLFRYYSRFVSLAL